MSDIESFMSDLMSDETPVDKRDILVRRVKNGESISNSKTPWTEERLQKASDKVIDKLYEKRANPPLVKIGKKEALEMGKPICPVVIEMYAEGLKTLMEQMPFVNSRYTINVEKLKSSLLANKHFCDNLAIQIGSKMIKQVGGNSVARAGLSLAAMTWDAVEPKKTIVINERQSISRDLLSTRESLEREKSSDRASKGDGASD